ncbi:hypothetical protein B0H19DRAFT_599818 [Mycena capillaripes]|nr:hypothetical protein B0H19DRAFT_599818 [Mycena capillaripes]
MFSGASHLTFPFVSLTALFPRVGLIRLDSVSTIPRFSLVVCRQGCLASYLTKAHTDLNSVPVLTRCFSLKWALGYGEVRTIPFASLVTL